MSLKARQSKEKRFQFAGLVAISIGLLCLVMLFASVLSAGLPAFQQTFIKLTFNLPADKHDKSGNRNPQEMKKVSTIGYTKVITEQLKLNLTRAGLEFDQLSKKELKNMISKEAPAQVRYAVLEDPSLLDREFEMVLLANG